MLPADDTRGDAGGADVCCVLPRLRPPVCTVCRVSFILRCWLLSEANQPSFKVTPSRNHSELQLRVDWQPKVPLIYFPACDDEPAVFVSLLFVFVFVFFIISPTSNALSPPSLARCSDTQLSRSIPPLNPPHPHPQVQTFCPHPFLKNVYNVERLKGRDRKESAHEGKLP